MNTSANPSSEGTRRPQLSACGDASRQSGSFADFNRKAQNQTAQALSRATAEIAQLKTALASLTDGISGLHIQSTIDSIIANAGNASDPTNAHLTEALRVAERKLDHAEKQWALHSNAFDSSLRELFTAQMGNVRDPRLMADVLDEVNNFVESRRIELGLEKPRTAAASVSTTGREVGR